MVSLKMIEIQDDNWMLSRKHAIVGFVFKHEDTISVLSDEYAGEYPDFDSFCKQHKVKITFEKMETKDRVQQELEGYPVKHSNMFNMESDPYPSYTKLEHSQDRYAAGYFGVKFKEAYLPCFCPRVSTLTSYSFVGPFKTTLERDHAARTTI